MMSWMKRQRVILMLTCVSGGLCLAAGLSYLTVSPTELSISWLVASGFAGCALLVGSATWQYRVSTHQQRLRLVVLGTLAACFTAASALGFLGARAAQSVRLEPTEFPAMLHIGGLVAGAALCIAVAAQFVENSPRGAEDGRRRFGARVT
jgi:hypothetical protein